MARNSIRVMGNGIRKEAKAGAGITPGHLLARSTTKVIVHGVAGGEAQSMFALEADLVGSDIDTAYVLDNQVQYSVMTRGEEVYAWLAGGENVVIGDFLESAGDGTLRKFIAGAIVGVALEDLNLSASGTPAARIIIEVI